MIPTSIDIDPRAKRWGVIAKYAALGVVGFVVSPYVFSAITGLIGLIIAGALMLTVWMLLPAVETAASNMRLKLLKNVAATNPVETLNEEHRRQTEELNRRREGIKTMAGAVRTLAETILQLEREFPDSPELEQMKADYAELKGLLDNREASWQEAYVTLGEFAKEIRRASRIWDVAVAAAKARGLSGLTNDEWMAKLKTETSFDAIRTKLNGELSALSIERMQADADRVLKGRQTKNVTGTAAPAALPAPSSAAIDVADLQPAPKVKSRTS